MGKKLDFFSSTSLYLFVIHSFRDATLNKTDAPVVTKNGLDMKRAH